MLLWRKWITQFPEGIPVSAWLFNGDKIRFRPAWFRWLGWERLTKLILGFVGMLFLPPVLLVRPWAKLLPLVGWWLSCLIYVSVIATGNVRHDYYQVFLIPVICLSVAVGMFQLWKWLSTKTTMLVSAAILGVLFTIMIRLAWEQVGGYYGTRADWEEAGRAVDKLLPPDAKIIAPAFGDTAFLFQTNRTGWPLGFDIDDKIAKGAQYYVTTAYDDEARELEQKYRVLAKTPAYLIIELTR